MNSTIIKPLIAFLAGFLAIIILPSSAYAENVIYTSAFNNNAAGGYDVVAYFTSSAPVKGSKDFETDYQGATWRFSSATNLATFQANPGAYAPQFGGYCAWAVSQNYTARGNPKNWTIVDGRLYLNYSDKIQARWEKDIPGFIALANQNWPGVLD